MNRQFVFIVYIFFSVAASGQWGLSPRLGVGSYNLERHRFTNDTYTFLFPQSDQTVQLQLLENFPPFLNYGLSFTHQQKNGRVTHTGYTYYSTGARFYYEDYSGYAIKDYIASAHAISFAYSLPLTWQFEQLHWFISPALMLGKFEIHSKYEVYDRYFKSYVDDQYTINMGATAGLEYQWNIRKMILSARIGYYLDIYKGTYQNNGWFDFDNPNSSRQLNWRGIRGSIAVYIPFSIFHKN